MCKKILNLFELIFCMLTIYLTTFIRIYLSISAPQNKLYLVSIVNQKPHPEIRKQKNKQN